MRRMSIMIIMFTKSTIPEIWGQGPVDCIDSTCFNRCGNSCALLSVSDMQSVRRNYKDKLVVLTILPRSNSFMHFVFREECYRFFTELHISI